jgi:XTP/dITP diphosphohydrolase
MRLLVATTNRDKLQEIRQVLDGAPVQIVALADLAPIQEPSETGRTFRENARQKALAYSRASGLVTVAEDSGLEIQALGGEPGVRSARFLGEGCAYAERFAEIFRRLDERPGISRDARFVTALAMVEGETVLFESETAIDGVIAPAPAGIHGFGYDPIFFYPPFGRTTAEMTMPEKMSISHRGRAFRDLRRALADRV